MIRLFIFVFGLTLGLSISLPALASSQCQVLKQADTQIKNPVRVVFVASAFKGDKDKFQQEVKKMVKLFEAYRPLNSQVGALEISLSQREAKENNICHYGCNGIERLLCCKVAEAKKMARACGDQEKQVLVVHNDTKYGGAGYRTEGMATTSIHEKSPLIAIHELGHSLFGFGDEYASGWATPKKNTNCDVQGCHKWGDLIDIDKASCEPNSCQNGEHFASGQTIMKSLHLPFGLALERLTCCTYRAKSARLPNYCKEFENIADLCRTNGFKELEKQLIVELSKTDKGWKLSRLSRGLGRPMQEIEKGIEIKVDGRKFFVSDKQALEGPLDEKGKLATVYQKRKNLRLRLPDTQNKPVRSRLEIEGQKILLHWEGSF